MRKDVVIIGAGAAGLIASTAGRRGRSVLVIDHMRRVANKVRISGGGRCNFTNLSLSSDNYVSRNPRFCKSALARFGPRDVIALIEKHRIRFFEKEAGQLFCSGRLCGDYTNAFRGMLRRRSSAPWRWTALATLGAMIVYQYVTLQVNRARHEYQVSLPEVSGPDGFNRVFRVHMNTLESMSLFLPLLWLSAATWGDGWAGALGATWVVGRFLFSWGYYRAVSLRVCGFGISNTVCVVMLVSCAYGVIGGSW